MFVVQKGWFDFAFNCTVMSRVPRCSDCDCTLWFAFLYDCNKGGVLLLLRI